MKKKQNAISKNERAIFRVSACYCNARDGEKDTEEIFEVLMSVPKLMTDTKPQF